MTEFIHYHFTADTKYEIMPIFNKLAQIKFDAYEKLKFTPSENTKSNHLKLINKYLYQKDDDFVESVLTIDKDVHGFAIFSKYRLDKSHYYLTLQNLFVSPKFQKNKKLKLGTNLLAESLCEIQTRKTKYIEVSAEINATGFYEKHGFVKDDFQPLITAYGLVGMRKNLDL